MHYLFKFLVVLALTTWSWNCSHGKVSRTNSLLMVVVEPSALFASPLDPPGLFLTFVIKSGIQSKSSVGALFFDTLSQPLRFHWPRLLLSLSCESHTTAVDVPSASPGPFSLLHISATCNQSHTSVCALNQIGKTNHTRMRVRVQKHKAIQYCVI